MKILAFDTSAKTATAAVIEDSEILCNASISAGLTHSQTLLPLVNSMLSASHISLDDIDLFAVSTGPGSFTGLRIAVAAVKGMAQGLDKPCIGVSTLEALAYNYTGLSGTVCAVMDARCNQVYTATFKVNKSYPERLTEDDAIPIETLAENLKDYPDVTFVGDGAKLCCNALSDKLSVRLAPVKLRYQDAVSVGLVAENMINRGVKPQNASELMPSYLRLPQAERELLLKNSTKGK